VAKAMIEVRKADANSKVACVLLVFQLETKRLVINDLLLFK